MLYVSVILFEDQAQKINMIRPEESTTQHDDIEAEILDGLCDPVHSLHGTVMTPSKKTEDGGGSNPSNEINPRKDISPPKDTAALEDNDVKIGERDGGNPPKETEPAKEVEQPREAVPPE